jgi:hypothetical protein
MAVLALLFGVAGGAVLAALAGAHRVETSYDRLLTEINAPDLLVPVATAEVSKQLTGTGVVETVRPVRGIARPVIRTTDGLYLGPDRTLPCQTGDHELNMMMASAAWGADGWSPMRLHEGRAPSPGSLEVAVPRTAADRVALRVGDRVELVATRCDGDEEPVLLEAPVALHVTAIGAGPLDVDAPGIDFALETVIGTTALVDALAGQADALTDVGEISALWLAEGRQLSDVGPAVGALVEELTVQDRVPVVRAGLRPDATALRVLAALTAIASVAVLGQVLARHLRQAEIDGPVLAALGASPRDRWLHGVVHAALIGVAAIGVAAVVAVAMSPRVPLGLAEAIEGSGGLWVHAPTMALGAVAVVAVIVALAIVPARRATRPSSPRGQVTESAAARLARWARLGPVATTGIRTAFEPGRGVSVASVRQGIAALALALGAVVGVHAFSAGLSQLRSDPRLLGWGWDALTFGEQDLDVIRTRLAALPDVERVTAGTWFPPSQGWQLSSGDSRANVYPVTFETGPDAIAPVVISGRAPEGPDEIVVARPLAQHLGVGIGDPVELTIPSTVDMLMQELGEPGSTEPSLRTETLEVVGTGVIVTDLESGVAMTLDGAARMLALTAADVAQLEQRLSDDQLDDLRALQDDAAFRPHALFVDVRGGPSQAVELLEGVGGGWIVPQRAQDLLDRLVFLDLSRPGRVPDALGGLFTLVLVGVMAHVVSSGARARREDLAILRALGLRRRQVHAALRWQATATMLLAALLGVSLGVIVGRLAWTAYARDLYVVPVAVTPWWWIAIVVVATVIAANLVAIVPAWRAARRPPVEDLHAE